MAERGREARPAAAAARDGRARRVQPVERQLRRRRLARLLPDARLDLEPGLPRLRRRPRQADRLVPRHRRTRQGTTRLARPIDRRPQPVRRMDRRRRTPRRAIPRPLPTPARRTPTSCSPTHRPPPGPHPPPPAAPAAAAAEPAADAAELAPPAMARGAGPKALAALAEAQKHMGTPYRWGGSTPQTGFDCSGLVQWAYAQAGVKIPRVTDDADRGAERRPPVRRAELLPGDLVFFRDPSGYVYHVGISMGGDKFLHAPRTGDVVKVASLDEPYYKAQFTGGRRFDERRGRAAPARGGGARRARASTPSPSPPPRPRWRATPPRRARPTAACSRRSGRRRRATREAARRRPRAGERRRAGAAPAAGERAGAAPACSSRRSRRRRPRRRRPPPRGRAPAAGPRPGRRAGRARRRRGRPAPEAAPRAGPPPDLAGVPADYPGDDAGQAELAKWLAKSAEKAGLPPELPVMAALVESGVQEPQLRRRRLRRLLPDARGHLEQGRVRRLPGEPGAADQVVHRHRAGPQEGADRRRRRRLRQGSRASGASGSPTSNVPPSSTAAATSCASRRRAGCSADGGGSAQSSPPPLEIGPSPPCRGRVADDGGGVRVAGGGVVCRGSARVARDASCPPAVAPVEDWCQLRLLLLRQLERGQARSGGDGGRDTVTASASITSAGCEAWPGGLGSPPPPAPATPNAAAKATITTPATMGI